VRHAAVAGELDREAPGRAAPPPPPAEQQQHSGAFDDASADIADIDARLKALQSFLKMAKTSAVAS
jgi:hypothetical protein